MTEKWDFDSEGSTVAELADRIAETNAAPDPEFFAMVAKTALESPKLSRSQLEHNRRMMTLQLELLTNTTDPTSYSPEQWVAYRYMLGPEISELGGFKEDLSDLTKPWQSALHDVLELYGNPEAITR